MEKLRIGVPMRVFLLVVASVMWAGILLTGLNTVHWLLYLPAVFFVFAGVTGLCPGMAITTALFGRKP